MSHTTPTTHAGYDIIMPTISRGGNSADSLMDMTMAAKHALDNALDAMARASDLADGRNHPGGDWTTRAARLQQAERCAMIGKLRAEMEAIAEYIADSGCL